MAEIKPIYQLHLSLDETTAKQIEWLQKRLGCSRVDVIRQSVRELTTRYAPAAAGSPPRENPAPEPIVAVPAE